MFRRAWWNLRLANNLSRLFVCERASVLREQGLLLCLTSAKRHSISKLMQSIRLAESHGEMHQKALTLVDLAKIESSGTESLGREDAAEAEMVLERIGKKTASYRSQHLLRPQRQCDCWSIHARL